MLLQLEMMEDLECGDKQHNKYLNLNKNKKDCKR
jgi:hypothetical protein